MKRLLLVLLAFWCAPAQPPATPATTTITGPVSDSFGNPYTGSITIQSQARTGTGFAITGTVRIVQATNGAIAGLALVPNDTSVPNLTSYRAVFSNNNVWTCIVPTSTTPVTWTMACTPNTTPPGIGDAFPVSQIIPCPVNGNVIGTVNGSTSCLPAVPPPPAGSGTWCLVAINGTLQWILCPSSRTP
jgi:hypothetical protein